MTDGYSFPGFVATGFSIEQLFVRVLESGAVCQKRVLPPRTSFFGLVVGRVAAITSPLPKTKRGSLSSLFSIETLFV